MIFFSIPLLDGFFAKCFYKALKVVWWILGTRNLPDLEKTGCISKLKYLPLASNELCVLNYSFTKLNIIQPLNSHLYIKLKKKKK